MDGITMHPAPRITHEQDGPDNRPTVYMENRKLIFRASGLGGCPRMLAAFAHEFTAIPAPRFMSEAADAGRVLEPLVKQRLRDCGLTIQDSTDKLDFHVSKSIIRGAVDGLVSYPDMLAVNKARVDGWFGLLDGHVYHDDTVDDWDGEMCVAEVKGMSAKRFALWREKRFNCPEFSKYAHQISIYMRILKMPALYIVLNRDSPAEPKQMDLYFVKEAPVSTVQIVKKVIAVELAVAEWTRTGIWPSCPPEKLKEGWCAMSYLHDDKMASPDILSDAQLQKWLASYVTATALEGQLKTYKDFLKKMIVEVMGDRESVQCGVYKAGWKESDVLDDALFKKAHPEVVQWQKSAMFRTKRKAIDIRATVKQAVPRLLEVLGDRFELAELSESSVANAITGANLTGYTITEGENT